MPVADAALHKSHQLVFAGHENDVLKLDSNSNGSCELVHRTPAISMMVWDQLREVPPTLKGEYQTQFYCQAKR
jgi:hypothetical protein